eukprot:15357759-Alexandrium_andersonii.AAC.1
MHLSRELVDPLPDPRGCRGRVAQDLKDFTSLIETRYTVVHKLVVDQCDEAEKYEDRAHWRLEVGGAATGLRPLRRHPRAEADVGMQLRRFPEVNPKLVWFESRKPFCKAMLKQMAPPKKKKVAAEEDTATEVGSVADGAV